MSEADGTLLRYTRHKKSPRAVAKQAGERYYSTGKPCSRGHMALRLTSSSTCVVCDAEDRRRVYERDKEKLGPLRRARYATDPEYRAREQKRAREEHRTPRARERQRADKRMRYRTDPEFRAKRLAEVKKARDKSGKNTARWIKHGVGKEEFEALLAAQEGVCAICGTFPIAKRSLHLDHDHISGRVRGILCRWCNTGLGNFSDDPELIRKALAYLEKHNRS